jgi:hypothetical protein
MSGRWKKTTIKAVIAEGGTRRRRIVRRRVNIS